MSKSTAAEFVKVGIEGSKNLPHMADIYEKIIQEFGGADAFARELYKFFVEAPTGSQQRAKVLETVLKGIQVLTDEGYAGSQADEMLLTEDELVEQIEYYLNDEDVNDDV